MYTVWCDAWRDNHQKTQQLKMWRGLGAKVITHTHTSELATRSHFSRGLISSWKQYCLSGNSVQGLADRISVLTTDLLGFGACNKSGIWPKSSENYDGWQHCEIMYTFTHQAKSDAEKAGWSCKLTGKSNLCHLCPLTRCHYVYM